MQGQHLLVKAKGGRCSCHGSVKIPNVAPSFVDVPRRAVRLKHTVTGDQHSRLQGLDLIQCREPFAPGFFIALREIEVRVVIDSIPRYHQTDARQVQRSRVRGVGVTQPYDLQFFSFKVEGVRLSTTEVGQGSAAPNTIL